MKKSILAVWVLVVLCFLVPFVFLRHVNFWYGSFLFFTLVGILVIALNVLATRDLGKEDDA